MFQPPHGFPRSDHKQQQRGLSVQNDSNLGSIRLVDLGTNPGIVDVPINEMKPAEGIPLGSVIMFKGDINTVPSRWKFCDGTHGTPDLRNRFILGTKSHPGQTGGQKESFVPEHTHSVSHTSTNGAHHHWFDFGAATTSSAGQHTHQVYGSRLDNISAGGKWHGAVYNYGTDDHPLLKGGAHFHKISVPTFKTGANHNHNHSISVSAYTAGSKAKEGNLPPYYKLAFIMKVK